MRPDISVLTSPIPVGAYFISERARRLARRLYRIARPLPAYVCSRYGGHFAVTRSLIEGLSKSGIAANYNPSSLDKLGSSVVVLSGREALAQAIGWKRAGRIHTLAAGPNLVDFPSDAGRLICSPEVDLCLVPGPLTRDIYMEDCPELRGRCVPWPAGVNSQFWSPSSAPADRRLILFYDKPTGGPTDNVDDYMAFVRERGHQAVRLRYGRYSSEEYRVLLRQSALMVGFTAAESQGLAWAEAWSTDVPTFVWANSRHTFNHPKSHNRTFAVSTAPYLNDKTGVFFSNRHDFERLFVAWSRGELTFAARQWILRHMTDEVCAENLARMLHAPAACGMPNAELP